MTQQRKVAFISGASYGIGAATAQALARAGYDLVLTATRVENLAGISTEAQAAGARIIAMALDVRSPESIERAFSAEIARFKHIDLLVNNAAITLRAHAIDVTFEQWNDVMETNQRGTFFMCQRMARHLVAENRTGSIVNIGSAHGLVAAAERSTYGISKAAIHHMTRMLAVEWAPHGIRVNAIAPGRVASGSPQRPDPSDAKRLEAVHARIPLKRSATSEEVAGAVMYLASPAADYITGQTLVLDGGLTSY